MLDKFNYDLPYFFKPFWSCAGCVWALDVSIGFNRNAWTQFCARALLYLHCIIADASFDVRLRILNVDFKNHYASFKKKVVQVSQFWSNLEPYPTEVLQSLSNILIQIIVQFSSEPPTLKHIKHTGIPSLLRRKPSCVSVENTNPCWTWDIFYLPKISFIMPCCQEPIGKFIHYNVITRLLVQNRASKTRIFNILSNFLLCFSDKSPSIGVVVIIDPFRHI